MCFWGNGDGTIVVDDMYLTNNSDYTREEPSTVTGISHFEDEPVSVYTLSGQLVRRHADRQQATQGLPAGIYLVGNKKVMVK